MPSVFGLALAAVAGLAVLNYQVAVTLLRLEDSNETFSRISSSMPQVEKPLAFSVDGMAPDHPSVARSSESLGLDAATREDLPETHPWSIGMGWILAANPYPPTLDELRGGIPPHITYGHQGTDGDFHQVTFFGGEADATPSILTPKARGEETGHGDYFVRYVFHLKRPGPTDELPPGSAIDLMSVDRSSHAGGSYNGFEEVELTLVATAIEAGLLALLIAGALWRRRRRQLPSSGP